jgi:hypothetical protein
MEGNTAAATDAGKRSLFERLHNTRLILWWSIAWALIVMALAPVVDYFTPLLDSSYANTWTPDLYWRLVMYWHGGIFIPWITVLAIVACMKFGLDSMPGKAGRLVRESIFVGGFLAVPMAGIAGIFNVYDRFALGIPLWTQIGAFLIGDEMGVALLVAMLVYARSKGFTKAGMPSYTVAVGVFGALSAALMGHMGGWITWFGPSPPVFNQYINATISPITGFYNDTAVQIFTQGVVGSHSHLMVVALMAGVVALVAAGFGHDQWSKNERRVANFGFFVMILALLGAVVVYIIAGVGNFQIPSFFTSGVLNGVAGDDLVTGTVALGAAFVLIGLLAHHGGKTFKDPLLLAVIAGWISIYLVIPVSGFLINFNEDFFKGPGLSFDQTFTRFHQDFGFFLLPALITLILALNASGISGQIRNRVGYLFTAGIAVTFVFGEAYTFLTTTAAPADVGQIYSTLSFTTSSLTLAVAVLGALLIGLGVLMAGLWVKKVPKAHEM